LKRRSTASSGTAAEEPQAPLELPRLDKRDEADRAIEEAHEHKEGRKPVLELFEVHVIGVLLDSLARLAQCPFQHGGSPDRLRAACARR